MFKIQYGCSPLITLLHCKVQPGFCVFAFGVMSLFQSDLKNPETWGFIQVRLLGVLDVDLLCFNSSWIIWRIKRSTIIKICGFLKWWSLPKLRRHSAQSKHYQGWDGMESCHGTKLLFLFLSGGLLINHTLYNLSLNILHLEYGKIFAHFASSTTFTKFCSFFFHLQLEKAYVVCAVFPTIKINIADSRMDFEFAQNV